MSDNRGKNIIGVFDSGLGGLTVFKYFLSDLPEYNYIYLGDNARLPYGSKSSDTIYHYTREAVEFLFKEGCNLVIIACNTATAQAIRKIQQEYLPKNYPNRRVLGVVRPLVEAIAKNINNKRVGVLATSATVNSNSYETELKKINPNIEVYQKAAPLLVPLIEEDWLKRPETKMILKKYLHPLKTNQINTLILACTHYPYLYKEIKKIMGKNISVPHPGEIISASLKKYLSVHPELSLKADKKPTRQYYTTDNPKLFKELGERFLEQKIPNLKQVEISEI